MAKLKPFYFNWQDETGRPAGWNSVWAQDKIKAIKLARAKESPAKDFTYHVKLENGSVEPRVERFTGLYVNIGSVRQITLQQLMDLDTMANRLSM